MVSSAFPISDLKQILCLLVLGSLVRLKPPSSLEFNLVLVDAEHPAPVDPRVSPLLKRFTHFLGADVCPSTARVDI